MLTDFLQAGGTANSSKNVSVNNVVINADGASVPAVHLGAYSTAKVNGNVTATFKNMPNMTIQDQRINGSTNGNIVGNLSLTLINSPTTSLTVNKRPIGGNLSLTLDNSDIETITGLDSDTISGTVSMTLKNFEEYYPTTDFAGVDALTVTDSVVCVGSTYAGPSTVTADADSILKLGGTANTQSNVPAVTGGGNAVLVAPGSSIPGDPISMKYDDRIDVSRSMLVEIIDAGTPTSDKVGYGVTKLFGKGIAVTRRACCGVGFSTRCNKQTFTFKAGSVGAFYRRNGTVKGYYILYLFIKYFYPCFFCRINKSVYNIYRFIGHWENSVSSLGFKGNARPFKKCDSILSAKS